MNLILRSRLSTLFFLQYLATGSWFVTLGTYMSKNLGFDEIIGTAYGMIGIATILSTLFAGMLADRFFATEKLLGVFMLLGGITLYWLSTIGNSRALFLTVMFLHSICYSCGIPLAVSLAFNSMSDPGEQYPSVRIFGSIGFIVAGMMVGLIPGAGASALPMRLGAAVHIFAAVYCLTLPHTPPKAKPAKLNVLSTFGLDVVRNVRARDFWILMTAVLVMVIPKKFYDGFFNNYMVEKSVSFQFGSVRVEPAAIQTLGQVVEMVTMLMLPFLIRHLGIKRVMVIGMFGWIGRFLLWAFGFVGDQGIVPFIVLGILMHGVSYDFFFISGQIWLDKRFPPDTRGRVQAFYWFVLSGAGVLLGSNVAGVIYARYTVSPTDHRWTEIWLAPAIITFVMLVIFQKYFKESDPQPEVAEGANPKDS
jgi:nucleoside transporter